MLRAAAALGLLSLLLGASVPTSASAQVRDYAPAAALRQTGNEPTLPGDLLSGEQAVGQRVVQAALARLGTPYAWGGGGPDGPTLGFCDGVNGYLNGVCMGDHTVGFDCSGLALYAWYQATDGAVLLPHYSVDQLAAGRPVPLDQLLPGDLLFFAHPGGPVHHVGIYAGGGAMIHAEHTGTVVTILHDVAQDPVWGPQLIAAARPTPNRAPTTATAPFAWALPGWS